MTAWLSSLAALGLVGALAALWLVACRHGRRWLEPGHGPLWLAAAALVWVAWGAVVAVAAPASPAAWLCEGLDIAAAGPGAVVSHAALALLALVTAFAVCRAAFGLLRPRRAQRPPIPRLFLFAGVAPDGAPLAQLRGGVRALAWVLLFPSALAPGLGVAADTTAWAVALATLLALALSVTAPARPRAAQAASEAPAQAAAAPPLSARVEALHGWLGAPAEAARLGARRPRRRAARDPICGLLPYGYQARLLADRPLTVGLAGPRGTGRTTAGVLLACHRSLEDGASALLLCPDRAAADATRALTERLLADSAAGLALTVSDGPDPGQADLWCVGVAGLERYLADHDRLDRQPFVGRLGVAFVDDVEALSGYRVPLVRFLLHRVVAASSGSSLPVVVAGDLGARAMADAARCLCASDAAVWQTTGEHGAASLAVRRYVVEAAPGGQVQEDFLRIARRDGLEAELHAGPWRATTAAVGAAPEVLVTGVGPRTAWRVLARQRHLPPRADADHAREYLLFEGDPLARLLARRVGADVAPWPAWFDAGQFPRMLTSVPGDLEVPQGLGALARRHLRAALSEAPQTLARLEQVFSAGLVEAELRAVRDSGLLSEAPAWAPGDAGVVSDVRLSIDGSAAELAALDDGLTELVEPRAGLSFAVRRELVDLVYFDRAIVTLDGARYEVRVGADGARVLTSAPNRTSAAIRSTRVRPVAGAPLAERRHRFRGSEGFVSLSGRVGLEITHDGVRHFDGDQRRVHEILEPAPRLLAPFVTSARVLCPPTDDPVALHTLAHTLRDVLDYFYLGATESLGVTWAGAGELGRAGVVLYDRHPDGLGNVYDVVDGLDWQALLSAARAVLAACDCQGSCAGCCESATCSLSPHNHQLDRHRTLALLDRLLDPAPVAANPLKVPG